MRYLHWLPIRLRIIFKILLLVYKSVHGLAPAYLSDAPESNIRSGMKNRLIESRTRLVTFGDRAFYKARPTLWNKLPTHITSQVQAYTELFQTKPETPSFYTRISLLNMPHLILKLVINF